MTDRTMFAAEEPVTDAQQAYMTAYHSFNLGLLLLIQTGDAQGLRRRDMHGMFAEMTAALATSINFTAVPEPAAGTPSLS